MAHANHRIWEYVQTAAIANRESQLGAALDRNLERAGPFATDNYIPTVEERPLIVTRDNEGRVLINEQPFESANIMAANGIIHAVDAVLTL